MTALRSRLAKLESVSGPNSDWPARIIAVKSNGASDDQVETFLSGQGLTVDHSRDHILHMRIVRMGATKQDLDISVMSVLPVQKGRRYGRQ